MNHLSARRPGGRGLLGLALTGLLALTACGANDDPAAEPQETGGGGSVVVGSADFPESQIIAEIYAGALKAEGIDADTKLNIGSREIYYGAVEEGSVDIVPEYSGNLLLFVNPEAEEESAEEIIEALPAALKERSGDVNLGVLEPAEAENKDSMVVTPETAEKYGLESLVDLGKVCDQFTIASGSTFQERAYGLPGLKERYGCVPKAFQGINDGGGAVTLEALLSGEVEVVNIYTTTPSITDNNLVVLEDPENLFIAQQVVPLVNLDTVNEEARDVLNEVSSQLTTEDLLNLNREVSGEEKRNPADAAEDWLAEKGLGGA
ncbi:ABC transporter substrate-binding protein [Arthrobacter crusticola]|uniref:ABC transporter substrate-binding protein n=1 Tax=Arthrobacter crusticola TaxID=2547960 RepID=A0A4V3AM71_9MICC|nr:ABC transporter substrate-binding protein [Arthrobacter crusticola]TDK25819.1 ABC transporter substrate-binding protein [Arthrobacter crusticola]